MTHQEFQSLLRKYRQGRCSAEEEMIINKWYDSIGQNVELNDAIEDEEFFQKHYWSRISSHIQRSKESKTKRNKQVFFSPWRYASAAAVFLVLIACIYLFTISYTDGTRIFTPSNSQTADLKEVRNNELSPKEILLQDGSRITLQHGSRVSYAEPFKSKREVYLEGEAFFEVTKDAAHPFLVFTNEVTTKVLGTSFFVRANRNEKEIVVTVKTGKVMVYTPTLERDKKLTTNLQEVIVIPNQQVVYNRKDESVEKKLVEKPQLILEQPTFKMNYSNSPVAEILEALEESYGVDIKFDKEALVGCTLTTDLSEEGLYERIEIICNALGATYSAVDTEIVIEAKGCK